MDNIHSTLLLLSSLSLSFSSTSSEDHHHHQSQSSHDYILQLLDLSSDLPLTWASSTSSNLNSSIHLIQFKPDSSTSLTSILNLNNYYSRPTQLKFSNPSHTLISGFSSAPIILGWDLRCPDFHLKPVIKLNGSSDSPFTCLDHSSDSNLIVGGATNEDDTSISQIEIFDLRSTSSTPIIIYDQSHSDSITNLEFDPVSPHQLLSASTDGLLVLHDTRLSDQDESILSIANVGASIAHARCQRDGKSIWAATDMETLSLWTSDHLTLVKDYGDLRQEKYPISQPSWDQPISYVINLADPSPISSSSRSAYFAGSQSGNAMLVDTTDGDETQWTVRASLSGGHQEMIRCASISRDGLIMTGGEDGQVCLWSTTHSPQPQSTLNLLQPSLGKTKPDKHAHRFKPYS